MQKPSVRSIALSLLIPGIACAVQWIFWAEFQPFLWLLFYPAVFFSAQIGGLWGGMTATLLSATLAVFFFVEPRYSFNIDNLNVPYSVGVFIVMGFLFSNLQERYKQEQNKLKRSEANLKKMNDGLEGIVNERALALQQANQRFENLVENMLEGVQILSHDWRYLYLNKAAEIHNRRPNQELLGRKYMDMWPGITDTAVFSLIKSCLEERITGNLENEFVYPDGQVGWFELRIMPVPEGVFIQSFDITERKQAEAVLKTTSQRFQIILSMLYGGILVLNDDNRVEFANRAFRDQFDLDDSPDELIGLQASEIIQKISDVYADPPGALARIQEIVAGGQPVNDEEIAISGGRTYLRDFIPIFIEGKKAGRLWHHLDITGRKQAEEALRLSESKLSALIENTDGSIWAVDEQYRWIVGNKAFHHNVSAALGRRLEAGESVLHPNFPLDVNAEWQAHYDRVLRGESYIFETKTHFDKSSRYIEYHFSPIREADGKIRGVTVYGRDITERKRAEDELRVALIKYKALFDCFPLGITVSDEAGNILETNSTAGRLLGVPYEEHTRRGIDDAEWKIVRPDGTPMPPDEFASVRAFKEKSVIENVEMGIVKPDNSITWISVNAAPLPVEGYGVVVTYGDITERKLAQEALRESETFVKTVLNNLPVGVAVNSVEPTVAFNYMNENFAKFYRTTKEKLADPDTFWDAAYEEPDFRETMRKQILDDLASGDPERMNWVDIPITRKGEATTFITARNIPIPNQPLMISTVWDVTERKRAEETLERTRNTLAEAQKIAHLGSFEYIAATQTTIWSEEEYRIYGLDPAGSSPSYEAMLQQCIHPDDAALLHDTFTKALQTHSTYELEHQIVRPDGSMRWVYDHALPYFNEQGELIRYLGITLDITDRKQAEERLRASEAKFKAVFNNAPVGISLLDPERKLLESNDMLEQIVHTDKEGLKAGAYRNRKYIREDGTEIPTSELASTRAIVERQIVSNVVNGIVMEDGGIIWTQVSAAPLGFPDPRIVVITQDITQRKQAEQALQNSEQRYRELIQNANSAIIRWKSDGNIAFFNEYAQSFFGYRPQEIIGKHVSILVPKTESSGGDLSGLVEAIVAHPEQFINNVNENIRKDGRRVWMVWSNKPVYNESGQLEEILAVGSDITERKQMEDELRRSNAELEQFAYVASHDLQEPLRAVAGMVQLLQQRYQGQLDERADEYIRLAVGGATRMQSLINDLLAYSRVERRGNPFQPTEANDALKSALRNLEASINEHQASIISEDLPTVAADATQLTQLFQNLIGNAIKFHGELSPQIHVGVKDLGPEWQFSVRDNGIGIEPQYFERIFLVFQRLHTRRDYPGTGIGLSICKKIAERHGGRIWVESTPGQGATFHFTIPHRS